MAHDQQLHQCATNTLIVADNSAASSDQAVLHHPRSCKTSCCGCDQLLIKHCSGTYHCPAKMHKHADEQKSRTQSRSLDNHPTHS